MVVVSQRRSTVINPLALVLGETSGLHGTSGVPSKLAGLCDLLGNQQSHNVRLTDLQVVELQRAVASQKIAAAKQAAAAVHAMIDEKVAADLKKVAPNDLPVQPVAGQTEKKKQDRDGDLLSSRSGSSQGARRRAKHAERAHNLLAYQEAYGIAKGTASEFNGTLGRMDIQVKTICVMKIANQWS